MTAQEFVNKLKNSDNKVSMKSGLSTVRFQHIQDDVFYFWNHGYNKGEERSEKDVVGKYEELTNDGYSPSISYSNYKV